MPQGDQAPESDAAAETPTDNDPAIAEPAVGTPEELAALSAPPAPADVQAGTADRPVDGARIGPAPAAAAAAADRAPEAPAEVRGNGYLTSAPVIILPAADAEERPTILRSTREDLAIVQPSISDINAVVLDRISYARTGDVVLLGRGRAGKAVRVYGNGLIVARPGSPATAHGR